MNLQQSKIRDLFGKLVRQTAPVAKRYQTIGKLNEDFCHGEQFSALQSGASGVRVTEAWWDDTPRIYINVLSNAVLTWTSLLTENRPSAVAYPSTDEPQDQFSSEVANKVIDFLRYELDEANRVHRTVQYGVTHGTAGLKIIYDAQRDRVTWTEISIFNYLIDPVPDYTEARWVIFERYIDEDEAQALFQKNGIDRKPEGSTYRNAAGEELHGIKLNEFWHKPCAAFPEGFYAALIDEEIVELMPYPYVFTDDSGRGQAILPIVLFKTRNIRDSAYGGTNLTDAIQPQRVLNECVSRLAKLVRQTSNVHLIVPKEIAQEWEQTGDDTHLIAFSRELAESAKNIGYTAPPQLPQALLDQREYMKGAVYDVLGINEVTAGADNKTRSGKSIERIAALDTMKNADAAKSFQSMVLNAWKLTLHLVQKYYTEQRKALITDRDESEIVYFNGADIQGVDIRLEESSALDRYYASRQENVAARAAAGTDPTLAQAEVNGPEYSLARRISLGLVEAYLQGEPIDLTPNTVAPAVLLAVIDERARLAVAQGNRADFEVLQRFRDEYTQMLQGPIAPQPEEAVRPEPGMEPERPALQ